MRNSKWYIHPALALVGLIYGANYNIAKIALNGYIPPFTFIAIRVSIATAVLWLLHRFVVNESIQSRSDFIALFKCSIFGVVVNQLLFFQGLSLTTAINASIIMTSTPILIVIMSYFVLKERVGKRKLMGLLAGLSGAVLIIYKKDLNFNHETFIGDVCVFVNAFSYGYYLVIVKPLMSKYHPLTVVKWIFTFGVIFVIPFGVFQMDELATEVYPLKVWMSIGYVILFTTVLVYWLNALTLGYVSASIVGMYIYVQPLFATFLGVLFFGEAFSVKHVIAAILIFIGVYMVNKSRSH